MATTKKHKTPEKGKKSLSVHKKKSKTMATKKKRKKSTALSAPRRRSSLPVSVNTTIRRRRKKKGLLSASGSEIKANAVHNGAAMIGGAVYGVASKFIANPWIKAGAGVGLAVGLGLFNMPFLGAGAAGAAGSDITKTLMDTFLHDGEMNDVEYVDPATLSDSGMEDENGNPIVMDADGMCYMQDGENSYQAIGNRFELSEGTNMPSVSMLPMMDAGMSSNPYNLANLY